MYYVQKRHIGESAWEAWFESSHYKVILERLAYYKSIMPANRYEYRVLHVDSRGVI